MGKRFIEHTTKLDIRDVPKVTEGCIERGNDFNLFIKIYNDHMRINSLKIYFSNQKTGLGTKRFFVCPHCGSRRQYLYFLDWGCACWECAELRHRSTNLYRGGLQPLNYKIKCVCSKLGTEEYFQYLKLEQGVPAKPYKMRWKTYNCLINELEYLQIERYDQWLRMIVRHFSYLGLNHQWLKSAFPYSV